MKFCFVKRKRRKVVKEIRYLKFKLNLIMMIYEVCWKRKKNEVAGIQQSDPQNSSIE